MGAGVEASSRRGGWRKTGIWVIVGSLLVAAAVTAFLEVGKWLVVQDPLEPADAIVVLSGALPYRAEEAAHLYQQGAARRVWVTRPRAVEQELQALGIEYRGEEAYSVQVLVRLGVPATAIKVLDEPIVNTADEIRVIAAELQRDGGSKVVLVTSPPHTRRVSVLWRTLGARRPQAIVRAAFEDPYDGAHWWRNARRAGRSPGKPRAGECLGRPAR